MCWGARPGSAEGAMLAGGRAETPASKMCAETSAAVDFASSPNAGSSSPGTVRI